MINSFCKTTAAAGLFFIFFAGQVFATGQIRNLTVSPGAQKPGMNVTVTFEYNRSDWHGIAYYAMLSDTNTVRPYNTAGQSILVSENGMNVLAGSVSNGRQEANNPAIINMWNPSSIIDSNIYMTIPAAWPPGTYYVIVVVREYQVFNNLGQGMIHDNYAVVPIDVYIGTPTITPTASATPSPVATPTGVQNKGRTEFGDTNNVAFIFGTPSPTITMTHTITTTFTPTITGTMTCTQTATPSLSATVTATVTPTATNTPVQTPTITGTVTGTTTSTSTCTVTRTNTPTQTATATQTMTEIDTATATLTVTQTITGTFTATSTHTGSATQTITQTETNTPDFTQTVTPTHSETLTVTHTQTSTPTFTQTNTPTETQTITQTQTSTPTGTQTNTSTGTQTVTQTQTDTPDYTHTVTPTHSETSTVTATLTLTVTPTVTRTDTQTLTQTATPTLSATAAPPTATPSITQTPAPTPTDTPIPEGEMLIYPNPYNVAAGGTMKFFNMPYDAKVIIYTVSGEKVVQFSAETNRNMLWRGINSYGEKVSPGVYYYVVVDSHDNVLAKDKLFVTGK